MWTPYLASVVAAVWVDLLGGFPEDIFSLFFLRLLCTTSKTHPSLFQYHQSCLFYHKHFEFGHSLFLQSPSLNLESPKFSYLSELYYVLPPCSLKLHRVPRYKSPDKIKAKIILIIKELGWHLVAQRIRPECSEDVNVSFS